MLLLHSRRFHHAFHSLKPVMVQERNHARLPQAATLTTRHEREVNNEASRIGSFQNRSAQWTENLHRTAAAAVIHTSPIMKRP